MNAIAYRPQRVKKRRLCQYSSESCDPKLMTAWLAGKAEVKSVMRPRVLGAKETTSEKTASTGLSKKPDSVQGGEHD